MNFDKAAVLGATGPAGLHITRELERRGIAVRVVSRDAEKLERMFPAGVERMPADLLKTDDTKRALEGCGVAFHCIGFPASAMEHHRTAARNVADGIAATGARCVHVSSYWAFLPVVGTPMNEDHPRQSGTPWMQHRRAAEDMLREAGAAIANLPDFYGPHVHTSTLQQPLRQAANGATKINWIGRADVDREYAFIPDAAATVVNLAHSDDAYGEHWLIPTAGPLNGRRVAEIASDALVPKVGVRGAGLAALRLASLFNAELRGFMQMVPQYVKPISYETIKIEGLLGPQHVTPYEEGIRRTLEWLRKPVAAAEAARSSV